MNPGTRLRTLVTAAAVVAALAPIPALASPAPAARAAAGAVTPGSYLAVVEKGPDGDFGSIDAKSQSLVVVSSTGETRTVYTRRVKHHEGFFLADWSADGATALLVAGGGPRTTLLRVDVATGATQELGVASFNSALLDPSGTGVLATAWKGAHSATLVLERISWAGAVTLLREHVSGQLIAGHDGTVLSTDDHQGRVQWLLSTADGSVVQRFKVQGYCNAVRWWDATRLLESCGNHSDLYLVDPTTGAHSQLTSGHGRGDYGHLDARQLGSRLYVQVAGACGYTYVAKVTAHRTKPLEVPGAQGNVLMIAAVGDDLVLEHAASCDGDRPRSVLALFAPSTGHETPLLTLGRHEDFGAVRLLGEVRASAY